MPPPNAVYGIFTFSSLMFAIPCIPGVYKFEIVSDTPVGSL